MGRFIWRSFIVMVIFLAGLLLGNIVAPKQVLQEKDIVAPRQVKTSLDLTKEEDFALLTQSQNFKEVYQAFIIEAYQKATLSYKYQLLKTAKNPQNQKDFIKAQKHYLEIVNYIEQNYPPVQEESPALPQENL